MKSSDQLRSPAPDVVRCVALFEVVAVHFFLNIQYYQTPMTGLRMYAMTLLRIASTSCVPLFLMLSGYLQHRKKPEKAYYLSLVRTLGIYLLASAACAVYRLWVLKAQYTLPDLIRGLFTYSAAPYSWYIEMYLGLFLLIPFLNAAYAHLADEKSRRKLVLSLALLTAGPSVLNVTRLFTPENWFVAGATGTDSQIFPDWWINLYPITYYCIGCHLRHYPLKLKKTTALVLFLAVVVGGGSYNFYRSYGGVYLTGTWQGWGSFINMTAAVLVFHLLISLDYSAVPALSRRWLARISEWSLGAYLVSWIFDSQYYPVLNAQVPDVHLRIRYFPVIVPAVFISSLALSAVLHSIYALTFGRLLPRRKQPL